MIYTIEAMPPERIRRRCMHILTQALAADVIILSLMRIAAYPEL